MGRRGPKPKSLEKLKVIGSALPKRATKLTCPRSLSLDAKRHWKQLVPTLTAAGFIGELDTLALARYCTLQARLDECERHLAKDGLLTEYPNGQVGKSHYIGIATDTSRLLIQLEKELGLTPYARKSMVPQGDVVQDEPAAKYFGS